MLGLSERLIPRTAERGVTPDELLSEACFTRGLLCSSCFDVKVAMESWACLPASDLVLLEVAQLSRRVRAHEYDFEVGLRKVNNTQYVSTHSLYVSRARQVFDFGTVLL